MKGLVIKRPWIERILDGTKTWEIRGSATHTRGPIALIPSGSGCVVGVVDVVDCLCLSAEQYRQSQPLHQISDATTASLPYPRLYAWVLAHPHRLAVPRPYVHPRGAVIWVRLPVEFEGI